MFEVSDNPCAGASTDISVGCVAETNGGGESLTVTKKGGGGILICTYLTHIIMVVAIDTLLLDVDGCYLYYAERSSHEAYWQ